MPKTEKKYPEWVQKQTLQRSEKGFVSPGAWVWLGIALDDGTALSIWDFDDENGINRTFSSCLLPTKSAEVVPNIC